MGVKDLVGIYEPPASDQTPSDTGSLSRRSQRGVRINSLPGDTPLASGSSRRPSPGRESRNGSPPRSSARFLQHSWLQPSRQNETRDIPLRPVTYTTPESDLGAIDTSSLLRGESSINTSLRDYHEGTPSTRSSTNPPNSRYTGTDEILSTSYAPTLTAVARTEDDTATIASSFTAVQLHPTSEQDTLTYSRNHSSVPAAVVFGRFSAPLFIPKLDRYLASLPIPEFSTNRKGTETDVTMFPPMDRLAAEKKSLDELEHNSSPTPAWRSRNTWFGLAVSWVLGITVWLIIKGFVQPLISSAQGSSALAPFYSVQGLLDTVQIFALILGTICKLNLKKYAVPVLTPLSKSRTRDPLSRKNGKNCFLELCKTLLSV